MDFLSETSHRYMQMVKDGDPRVQPVDYVVGKEEQEIAHLKSQRDRLRNMIRTLAREVYDVGEWGAAVMGDAELESYDHWDVGRVLQPGDMTETD